MLGAGLLGFAAVLPVRASGEEADLRPEVGAFIGEMVVKHGFEAGELAHVFSGARHSTAVIRAISTPASALPWEQYRRNFVNARRIQEGVRFWDAHAEVLSRARRTYGVPEHVVVGLIGVETFYGMRNGNYRVIDALTTLAFDYPPRAEFFRRELEEYLLLARELPLDATRAKGSYAGAIGIPQFMPSSYRRYAVDFDGDGHTDLMGNGDDAIGSVANYLKAFGWEPEGPVAGSARAGRDGFQAPANGEVKPQLTVEELERAGITPLEAVAADRRAALVTVSTAAGPEHWLAYDNFYVLTRYNRSNYYALAVVQLGEEVRLARERIRLPR
ncbi:MAG: lytic murein transglycosylase B [Betaproteobacteria bacterium]|nr:lytic murein transglycosylase B [Betaproteobacteria bacterium]